MKPKWSCSLNYFLYPCVGIYRELETGLQACGRSVGRKRICYLNNVGAEWENHNCVGLKLAETRSSRLASLHQVQDRAQKMKICNAAQAKHVSHPYYLDLTSAVMFFNANTCLHPLFLWRGAVYRKQLWCYDNMTVFLFLSAKQTSALVWQGPKVTWQAHPPMWKGYKDY